MPLSEDTCRALAEAYPDEFPAHFEGMVELPSLERLLGVATGIATGPLALTGVSDGRWMLTDKWTYTYGPGVPLWDAATIFRATPTPTEAVANWLLARAEGKRAQP